MQQHSGQHVLSAAFVHLYDAPTVSFHLGTGASTIDLAREMTPVEISAAEDEANRIVWENRPVSVRYASAEDAATLGLRKESHRAGTLRLVDVARFDLSACGGSHVTSTGEIGVIAIGGWERFKGGQRLEFLCGGRVLSRFRGLRDVTSKAVRLLSVLPEELPGAIERLQTDGRQRGRAEADLHAELARYRAAELASSAEAAAGLRLVLRTVDGDAESLKTLARAVTADPGFLVVLVSRAAPAVVVVARAKDAPTPCDEIVKSLIRQFGGRGGGRSDLAQAGGLNGSADAILSAARQLIL
jgi:alanyl-tRNA synthetase